LSDDDDQAERQLHGLYDVGSFSLAWQFSANKTQGGTPTGDSDPYSVYVDEDEIFVTDAAANILVGIKDGVARQIAFFPITYSAGTPGNGDSVPTCVTKGRDGYLYVGTLEFAYFFHGAFGTPAGPGGPGHSNIYRVDPRVNGQVISSSNIWASNLSLVTDITYSRHDDSFYVVEFGTALGATGVAGGDVVRIPLVGSVNPTAGPATRLGVGQLTVPNGLAVSRDGDVYVSDCSSALGGPCTGRVVKVNW